VLNNDCFQYDKLSTHILSKNIKSQYHISIVPFCLLWKIFFSSCTVSTPLTSKKKKHKEKNLVLTESKESVSSFGPMRKTWRYDLPVIRIHSLLPLLLLPPHSIIIANRQFLYGVLPYVLMWQWILLLEFQQFLDEKNFSCVTLNHNIWYYHNFWFPMNYPLSTRIHIHTLFPSAWPQH